MVPVGASLLASAWAFAESGFEGFPPS